MRNTQFFCVIGCLLLLVFCFPPVSAQGGDWEKTAGPAGGNMECVAIDPADARTVYAGGKGGTLYKSTNAGVTWEALYDQWDRNMVLHQVVIVPGPGPDIFVNTGTVYKSADGGTTFSQIHHFGQGINQLATSPADSLKMAAAGDDGLLFLTGDGFETASTVSGIWNGLTVRSVAMDANGTLWAGTGRSQSGGLYRSIDNGDSWTPVELSGRSGNTAVSSIWVDPDDADTIYVGLEQIFNEPLDATNDGYLFKSTDGGGTWTALFFAEHRCRHQHPR